MLYNIYLKYNKLYINIFCFIYHKPFSENPYLAEKKNSYKKLEKSERIKKYMTIKGNKWNSKATVKYIFFKNKNKLRKEEKMELLNFHHKKYI